MKKLPSACGMTFLLCLYAVSGLHAAMSLSDIEFNDTNVGEVDVSATVAGTGAMGGMVFWQAALTSELLQIYGPPVNLNPGDTTWNDTWNPYFQGTYNFTIGALAFPPTGYPVNSHVSHPVTASREISGTLNAIQYIAPVGVTRDGWTNIDTGKVRLHCIGYNNIEDVGSIGCNLLNADFEPSGEMTEEETDIGYTDIADNYPVGTPFRFNVNLHARPTSIMAMGEMGRYAWTPDDEGTPDGPGNLVVDVSSCSPWRSTYATPLGSHVGFAPLYFEDEEDLEEFEGALMSTTAHYMDVSPSMSEDDADRIGLLVNGHPGTTNYLQIFLPDRLLEAWGLTDLEDADAVKEQLGYFVDGLQLDEAVAAPEVTRLTDESPVYFDWDGDGSVDNGYLVRFSFVFPAAGIMASRSGPEGIAAEVGPRTAEPVIGPVIKANGQTGQVTFTAGSLVNLTVELNPGQYVNENVDWFVVACRYEWEGMAPDAVPEYYYLDLNNPNRWMPFDSNNLATCRPAHMGPLFNLPVTPVMTGNLPGWNYQFWFIVDYPMNGRLDMLPGLHLISTVTLDAVGE